MRINSPAHYNAGAWLLWMAASMLAALITRNPFYLAIVLAVALVVDAWLQRLVEYEVLMTGEKDQPQYAASDPTRRGRALLLRAMIVLTLVVALLKAISLHIGVTVLFRLPDEWPVIGGAITLESLVSSSVDALSLLAVLAVFATFSAGADYYALLRSLPTFLHQVGLVTSIAITFVPQTVTRFAEIREAQALRGHRIRRVGDLLPLIMPLLAGGMERSMNLAEAMEARGFSRHPEGSRPVRPIVTQTGIAAGLALILTGGAWATVQGNAPQAGWAVMSAGVVALGMTLWAMGRGIKRTRYRRPSWAERDTILAACSIGVIAFLIAYRLSAPSALIYYPLPRLYTPTFDPIAAIAILCLAAPMAIELMKTRQHAIYGTAEAQRRGD